MAVKHLGDLAEELIHGIFTNAVQEAPGTSTGNIDTSK